MQTPVHWWCWVFRRHHHHSLVTVAPGNEFLLLYTVQPTATFPLLPVPDDSASHNLG